MPTWELTKSSFLYPENQYVPYLRPLVSNTSGEGEKQQLTIL